MFNYSQWLVDFLAKAAGHKYIKRIPYQSKGKMRYRYIYHVTHTAGGKHVLDPEHMVVGAAFQVEAGAGKEVHAHIVSTSGENVTYKLDDGPDKDKMFTVTRAQLASKINEAHGVHEALAGAREKQAKVVADLKARGASEKQVAREQARLERLSVSAPASKSEEPKSEEPKSEEPKKRAAKKPKSVELEPAPDYYGDEGHDMREAYVAKYGDEIADLPPRKEDMELVEGGARVETEKRKVDVNTGKAIKQMELVTFPQLSTERMVLGLVPNDKYEGHYSLTFTALTGPQKGAGVRVMVLSPDSVAPSTRAKQIVHGMMQMGTGDALAQFDPSNPDTYAALQKVLRAVKASDPLTYAGSGLLPSASKVARAREFARAFARGDDAAIAPAPKKSERPKTPTPVRSVDELKELHAKVFKRRDLWRIPEDELKAVVTFAKKKKAEFKDDARGYLAMQKERHAAEKRMERARNDDEYARAEATVLDLADRMDDDHDGRRAYDAYNEYADSERLAHEELDRRKAASAN